ncbi:molybdenum cofactor synthesis protein, partial [bacterium]|nr:molybdenum cofactor synthesis protein [candidate division CSSED10-310 bacterium]
MMNKIQPVSFSIESLNISQEKGTVKQPVAEVMVTDRGISADAHAGVWHRQISLLAAENIEAFARTLNRRFTWGEFAENITTRGIDLNRVAVLDRFRIGTVELEVTQIGKACHHGCAVFQEVGACIMPTDGIFARVISPGRL